MKTVSATLAALIILSPLGAAQAQDAPKPPGAEAPSPANGAGGEEKPGGRGKAPGQGGARSGETRPGGGGEAQPGGEPRRPKASEPGAGEPRPAASEPGEQRPGGTKPGTEKPAEARPGEGEPGAAKPGAAKPGEPKAGEARPKDGRPGEAKPGEARPGEARPGEAKPGEARPGVQGRPAGAARAAPRLAPEQRTRVVTTFRSVKVAPVHVDFAVRVGVAVPRTVALHPVPTEIVSIVPEFGGFRYFVVPGEIVIVDPETLDIIDVLPF